MKNIRFAALILAGTLLLPGFAMASLGGNLATVQADSARMKASLRIARSESTYTVHELQSGSGTLVREYVAKNGTIFGVAWRGPVMPDLQQVLGQYFTVLSDSGAVKRSSHAQMHVKKDDLVMHSSGHMRAFAGQAYLASQLPQGVTAGDIQ